MLIQYPATNDDCSNYSGYCKDGEDQKLLLAMNEITLFLHHFVVLVPINFVSFIKIIHRLSNSTHAQCAQRMYAYIFVIRHLFSQ